MNSLVYVSRDRDTQSPHTGRAGRIASVVRLVLTSPDRKSGPRQNKFERRYPNATFDIPKIGRSGSVGLDASVAPFDRRLPVAWPARRARVNSPDWSSRSLDQFRVADGGLRWRTNG
jgi:hypothetical protein